MITTLLMTAALSTQLGFAPRLEHPYPPKIHLDVSQQFRVPPGHERQAVGENQNLLHLVGGWTGWQGRIRIN